MLGEIVTTGDVTFSAPVTLLNNVTVIDAATLGDGITFNGTVDGQSPALSTTLTLESNLPFNITAPVPPFVNFPVTLVEESLSAVTITVDPGDTIIDFSGVDVPVTVIINGNTNPVTVIGGLVSNDFIVRNQMADVTLVGGPAPSTNDFDIAPANNHNIALIDGGGTNTIDVTSAVVAATPPSSGEFTTTASVGVTIDLNETQGQVQLVYQSQLNNPDTGSHFNPNGVTSDSTASLSLQGRFQSIVGGNGDTFYAAGSSSTDATDLSSSSLGGTKIILAGSDNTVFGAQGSIVQAFSGGNNVIQNFDPTSASAISAFLADTVGQTQSFLAASNVGKQAFLKANAAGFATFLASTGPDLQAFLTQAPTVFAQYILTSPTAEQAYLQVGAVGISAFLVSDSAAVSAFIGGNSAAKQAFDAGGTAGLQAFLENNLGDLQAFLDSDTGALQAFLDGTPTALAQFVLASPTSKQAFLQQDSTAVSTFLTTNVPGRQAFLEENNPGVSAFIGASPTAKQAFLAADSAAVTAFIGASSTAKQAFLQADPGGVSAYLVSTAPAGILNAFLNLNPPAKAAYGAGDAAGQAALQAFLENNLGDLQAFLDSDNGALQAYLDSSPTTALFTYLNTNGPALDAYLEANAPSVAQFIGGNPTARQTYLSSPTADFGQFLGINNAAKQAFLQADPGGISAYLVSTATTPILNAFLNLNPPAKAAYGAGDAAGQADLQSFLENNLGDLQAFLDSDTGALQAYLGTSPTKLLVYLSGNPSALSAFLQSNAPDIANFIAGDAATVQSYVASDTAGVITYLLSNTNALNAFLAANPLAEQGFLLGGSASVQAYIGVNPGTLPAFFTANPGFLLQYVATNPPGLQAYLSAGSFAGLQQYLNSRSSGLAQYLSVNPNALVAYLTGNLNALESYVTPGSAALQSFLENSPTVLEQYVTENPSAIEQFLTNNPDVLVQFIADNPDVLQQYLSSNPDILQTFLDSDSPSLQQFLTDDPTVLLQFIASDPDALQQFFEDNPAILQQFLGTDPDGLQQFLSEAILSLFRFTVNLPGTGNEATGGLLSTYNIGNGLFIEQLTSAELQLINGGVAQGTAPSDYALNVTMDGGNNTVVGGVLGNFTTEGNGSNNFVIEDPSLLGLPSGTPISPALAAMGGTFTGSGSSDTFYFVGGSPGNNFGSYVLNEPAGARGDTLDFSNFVGDGVNIDLNTTGVPQLVNAASTLSLTLPTNEAFTNVIGSPGDDTIIGNGFGTLQGGAADNPNPSAMPAPLPSNPTQWVVLNFTQFAPTFLGPGETFHNGDGSYTVLEQEQVLQGLSNTYSEFGANIKFSIDPAEIAQLQSEGDFADADALASFVSIPAGVYDGGDGNYVTIDFNHTPVFDNQPSPGGFSNEVDFGNVNQKTTVQLDVNGFLGNGPGEVPDSDADSLNGDSDFVNMSITISAHELGHTLGLEHMDALGPIGFGIANPPGLADYFPDYAGPVGAFTTAGDVIASPASVGSTLANAADGLAEFGARDAITLAFILDGTTVAFSDDTDPFNPDWTNLPSPIVSGASPVVPIPWRLAGVTPPVTARSRSACTN